MLQRRNQLALLSDFIFENLNQRFAEFEFKRKIISDDLIALSILFKAPALTINYNGSFHHLDMPWQLTSHVELRGKKLICIEKYFDNYNYTHIPRYELHPYRLKNENGEMNNLAEKIANDLTIYVDFVKSFEREMP